MTDDYCSLQTKANKQIRVLARKLHHTVVKFARRPINIFISIAWFSLRYRGFLIRLSEVTVLFYVFSLVLGALRPDWPAANLSLCCIVSAKHLGIRSLHRGNLLTLRFRVVACFDFAFPVTAEFVNFEIVRKCKSFK